MITIYKYPLDIIDMQKIYMPRGAKILTVQMQGKQLCLWAEVDTKNQLDARRIAIVGTGSPAPEFLVGYSQYISTVQERTFVWHVYEVVI